MVTITKFAGNGVEGIVFDAVGTLIDPFPSVAEVYAAAAGRQGIALERREVQSRFARHFRHDEDEETRGPLATDEPAERRRWRRIVADVLPEVPDPDRLFEELWDHFGRADAWRTFPDVGPTFAGLRARGTAVRIASNFDGRLRGVVAGLGDLAECADRLVLSSEVGYRKPHPRFYEAARASLDLPADRVLYVGDDLENDVRGPLRAGLRGLWLDRFGHSSAELPRIADLTAVLALWSD